MGVTNNFLSVDLIEELKLPLSTTANYGVIMGTRMAVRGKGICKGVILEMQGLIVVEDFLPLMLGSADVKLGIQWSATLGVMEINWPNLAMKFPMGDTVMTLKGDPSLSKTGVSLKALMKEIQQHGQGVMVECCNLHTEKCEATQSIEELSLVEELKRMHPKVFKTTI